MAQITAAQVKELREKTGAGMMECKSALTEADGNIEEAVKILRKKGLAAAAKKAGRITSEGVVAATVAGDSAVLVEVNCETDFVAQTDDFKALVDGVSKLILEQNPADVTALLELPWPGDAEAHTVGQVIASRIAKIGENISVRRFTRLDREGEGAFGSYIHANGKIGVVVEVTGSSADGSSAIAREVAMHVAASEPRFARREEVTEQDLATEREIARDQALKSGKPEAVIDKIVSGKMEKYYAENVLGEQPYIRDDKLTVSEHVSRRGKEIGSSLEVARFVRYKLGEGLEKRSDDFAAEVMAQIRG
jgi:elongation factor Ts